MINVLFPAHKKKIFYVDSDTYFNDSDKDQYQWIKDMGDEVTPVDMYGGMVPENKSLDNLKKNEKAIRDRFNLETDK